jgi:DNA-binding LacI/PurR family transcriptional regulator
MAIVCFDDSILFRLGSPSVTVVAQPVSEMGQVAVRLVIEMIGGGDMSDRKVILSPSIIEREST